MLTILANRSTGQLRTLPADQAEAYGPDWIVVCREPDDCAPSLTEDERQDKHLRCGWMRLEHDHDGSLPASECPVMTGDGDENHEHVDLLPPDQWTAEDLASLQRQATRILRTNRVHWTITLTEDRRRSQPHWTEIRLQNGWKKSPLLAPDLYVNRYHDHTLVIKFPGRPNAVTLAWILQHAAKFEMALAVQSDHAPATPADEPETTTATQTNTTKIARLVARTLATCLAYDDPEDDDDPYDIAAVLLRMRQLFKRRPKAVIQITTWLAKCYPNF